MAFQPLTQSPQGNNQNSGGFHPLSTAPIVRTQAPQAKVIQQPQQAAKPQQNIFQGITQGIGNAFSAVGSTVHNELFGGTTQPMKLSSGQSYSLSQPTQSQPSATFKNNSAQLKQTSSIDPITKFANSLVNSSVQTLGDIKNAVKETGQAWLDIPQDIQKYYSGNKTPAKPLSPSAQRGLDFIGGALMGGNVESGAVSGNVKFITNQAVNKVTKNITETPGISTSFVFSPKQVQQVVIGNNTGMAKDILASLNMTSAQWKIAVKTGAQVEIKAPSVIQIADKPWFAKFKQALGNNTSQPTNIMMEAKPTIKNIAGLLGSGEHTPEDLTAHVIHNNAADTPQGKELLKLAVTAKQQGKNVVIHDTSAVKSEENVVKSGVTPSENTRVIPEKSPTGQRENGGGVVQNGNSEAKTFLQEKNGVVGEGSTIKTTPYDTPTIIKARSEQAKIPSTHEINTPEREVLRQKVADTLYKNGGFHDIQEYHAVHGTTTPVIKSGKRADIVTGLPASGKNTALSNPLLKQHSAMLIDKDEGKMGIPESNGGTYNGTTHKESGMIQSRLIEQAVSKGHNIVIPTVGTHIENVRGLRDDLIQAGYDVHLHHAEVSVKTSAKRAIKRFEKTGKFVDPSYIYHEVGLTPNKNYDTLKTDKEWQSYEKYSTEENPHILLESSAATNEQKAGGTIPQSVESRNTESNQNIEQRTELASTEKSNSNTESIGGRVSGQPERATEQQTNRAIGNGQRLDIGEPQGKYPQHTSVTLGVGIDPGIKQFFEGEIQPAYHAVKEVGKEWQSVINPSDTSKKAQLAAQLIKEAKAHIANYQSITANKYHSYRKFFNKYGDNQNIANISHYEKTGQFAKAPDAGYSKLYHDSLEESYKILLSAYGKEPESFIENYVRRQFVFGTRADEEKGVSYLTNYSRSLSASKSPMLKRVLDMPLDEALKDMKDRGIKVKMASTNPEELRQWSLINAQQALAYRQAWNDAKESKLITFVRKGDQIPEDLVKLNDRAAQVFAPAELHFPEGKAEDGSLTFKDEGYQSAIPMGQYYATPEVARVFNNAIATGLEGSATYKGARFVSNTLNQFQLGVSAFHLGAVGIDAGVTDLSVGMAHLLQGHPIKGIKHMTFGAIPFASFTKDMYHGRSIINDLKSGNPEASVFLEKMLNPGGGRLGLDARYRNKALENLQHAIHNNNPLGVLTRAALYFPSAMIQAVSHPLLGYAVPRVKLGAFMSLAELKLSRLPSTANQAERNRALMSAWQSIDNRMGQLTYDNLGWNKAFKDILMMSVRSVGWDYGTLGELGGGARDLGKGLLLGNTEKADTTRLFGKRGISDKTMWSAALVVYAGALGAIYMYLHTGQWPQELKDYFNPKNGLTDKNGNPDRMRLPTYMKDVFAYTSNPLQTSIDKASPLLNWISAMVSNKDYYGNLIRNPDDPISKQLEQVGAYALKNATPFGIQQASQSTGNFEQKAEGFVGINKAPQSVIKSDQQKELDKAYRQTHGLPAPKTPEQVDTANLKAKAREEIVKNGWRNSPSFHKLMQDGTLKTQRQRIQFIESAKLTSQQRMLKTMPKAERAKYVTQ